MGGNNGHDNHKLGAWWGERIELLKALWRKGLSASEIGNELGVSRNAVIGKLHRIEGYTPEPHKPAPPRQSRRRLRYGNRRRQSGASLSTCRSSI